MRFSKVAAFLFGAITVMALSARIMHSQAKAGPSAVKVHMVVTDQRFSDNNDPTVLRPENVQVKQGKNVLEVEQLIPARGDNAALQLFILIDDTLDPRVGSNLDEIRDFISAQPESTVVGVGYMSNATFQVVQNFTADHAVAAKSVRLPRGRLSAMDSPYLSLMSLVKSWPQQKVRREVLVLSDGIDVMRGRSPMPSYTRTGMGPSPSQYSTRGGMRTFPTEYPTSPSISPDTDSTSAACQRFGVIVYSIYAVGAGRIGRNAWEAQLGQSGIAKIAEETGGEYFSLGTSTVVSFKPYLERLESIFLNQYYVVFHARLGKKDGLQRVDISTNLPDVDLAAADNVWVSAKE
jgi:hypothetical protein